MSIFAISITPERALVAADTACTRGNDPWNGYSETVKLYPIPQWNLLLCGLGCVSFHREVNERLIAGEEHFDHATVGMRLALDQLYAQMLEAAEAGERAALSDGNTLLLVGWSERNCRMDSVIFSRGREDSFFRHHRHSHGFFAKPWDLALSPTKAPASIEEMEHEANRVVQFAADECDPLGPFGGRLVIADVARDSMSIAVRPSPAMAAWRHGARRHLAYVRAAQM